SPCVFASVFLVNLLTKQMARDLADDVLAKSIVGTRLVRVAAARVTDLARSSRQPVGQLLGTVIAHELGHLLLDDGSHSIDGIMQETLDDKSAQQSKLLFVADQGSRIRARATALMNACNHARLR